MTGEDIVAVLGGSVASVCLALRAYMLKPAFDSWCSAPARVWASLLAFSVVCALSVLSIAGGHGHATAREAMVLVGAGVAASVMLINLHRQAPPRP
ncbi:hypothetical protein SGCZBJ_12525 [Caulobacter zeae]|uniref:Uncharacterized protein n=1 Tax=Caulobacter zeae TaxID=2055137 RepID=A0A2N5DG72_9CAUL|nr:hypothetical protein [Caulobacter zeae]PLR25055.1 hypothetical protein SGCZBJ_12525 [Caulobacter zeae]